MMDVDMTIIYGRTMSLLVLDNLLARIVVLLTSGLGVMLLIYTKKALREPVIYAQIFHLQMWIVVWNYFVIQVILMYAFQLMLTNQKSPEEIAIIHLHFQCKPSMLMSNIHWMPIIWFNFHRHRYLL